MCRNRRNSLHTSFLWKKRNRPLCKTLPVCCIFLKKDTHIPTFQSFFLFSISEHIKKVYIYYFLYFKGADKRFSNGFRGRRGILQSFKCNCICSQCRKCPSFHQAISTNYTEKHSGYQKFAWDLKWPWKHF